MKIGSIKRLFRARHSNDYGSPVPFTWIADPFGQTAVLVSPASGRVLAYVDHDGFGKYEVLVVVSPWRALRLVRKHLGSLVSLLSFPRVTVELGWLKVTSLGNAQDSVEQFLQSA